MTPLLLTRKDCLLTKTIKRVFREYDTEPSNPHALKRFLEVRENSKVATHRVMIEMGWRRPN